MLGPLVGGALLAHFWWGSVFLLGVPFMALLLVVGPALLPGVPPPPPAARPDQRGPVPGQRYWPASTGVTELAANGWSALPTPVLVIGRSGCSPSASFASRRRLAEPLLDLWGCSGYQSVQHGTGRHHRAARC